MDSILHIVVIVLIRFELLIYCFRDTICATNIVRMKRVHMLHSSFLSTESAYMDHRRDCDRDTFSNWRSSPQPYSTDMKNFAKVIVYAAVTLQCAEFGAAVPASDGHLRGLSSAFLDKLLGGGGIMKIIGFVTKLLSGLGGK